MKAAAGEAENPLELGFQLGELYIEPRAGLATGPGGRQKLDPKVMGVLVAMAENAGQVVLREDLLARFWPNVVVTDDALSRCFYELRRQLSLAGATDDYRAMFETLPKRGYRMNAVVKVSEPPQSIPGLRPWRRRAGIALAMVLALGAALFMREWMGATPPASIAVLPFIDMSEAQDQGYLADGIAEEILNQLSQSKDLRVIARTSSFALRGKGLDIAEIARKLNVTHVLEGSIRRSGDKLRITAQLIAASDSSHVWSATVERELSELFTIQDQIAISVASALKANLVPSGRTGSSPSSIEAQVSFQRGSYFYYRRGTGDVERAIQYYQEAIRIDPDYARAWAGLAGAYSIMAWDTEPPTQALVDGQGEAARRAVQLAPSLALAQFRLFQYYFETGDRVRAAEHKMKAIALDPAEPLVLSEAASDALDRDDLKAATELLERTVAMDPLGSVWRGNLAALLVAGGRLEEGLAQYRRVQEDMPNGAMGTELDIVRVLVLLRRLPEAESALGAIAEERLLDIGKAIVFAALGDTPKANIALQRVIAAQDLHENLTDKTNGAVQLAEVYAFRGMNESALRTLLEQRAALERRLGPTRAAIWRLRNEARLSPFLNPLHADPRWSKITADPA